MMMRQRRKRRIVLAGKKRGRKPLIRKDEQLKRRSGL
jgi:hypothetical protein